ncbi:unnamed protein product [Pleuronectes platessa]|uniref:Uncharacterized protein n=1 Tax=Pleuronectes platessa TaxID=8262 RepID=A0A9N7VWR2_PLEPL|nr:unnamed protein product [Pleuronectes platessa]
MRKRLRLCVGALTLKSSRQLQHGSSSDLNQKLGHTVKSQQRSQQETHGTEGSELNGSDFSEQVDTLTKRWMFYK